MHNTWTVSISLQTIPRVCGGWFFIAVWRNSMRAFILAFLFRMEFFSFMEEVQRKGVRACKQTKRTLGIFRFRGKCYISGQSELFSTFIGKKPGPICIITSQPSLSVKVTTYDPITGTYSTLETINNPFSGWLMIEWIHPEVTDTCFWNNPVKR